MADSIRLVLVHEQDLVGLGDERFGSHVVDVGAAVRIDQMSARSAFFVGDMSRLSSTPPT